MGEKFINEKDFLEKILFRFKISETTFVKKFFFEVGKIPILCEFMPIP